jgi:FkbM family methyltransferase
LLPAGISNEPETQKFLENALDYAQAHAKVTSVDVGASVGDFAITMAYDDRVKKVLAFEPHPATCSALQASAEKVPTAKIEIIQRGVAASAGTANFNLNELAPTGAGLHGGTDTVCSHSDKIELCALDDVVIDLPTSILIILIDIEGGELSALRGASRLIENLKPLIIFEYNDTTRKHFQLSQAAEELGADYHIHRLRSQDGRLDSDLSSTWNVVALPNRGPWQNLSGHPGIMAE